MAREYSAKASKKGMDMLRVDSKGDEYVSNPLDRSDRRVVTVDISINTIITILFVLALIYLGGQLIQVAVILFFAFILSSASLPSVRWFVKKGVGRGWAIALTYLGGILLLAFTVMLVVVPFISETERFVSDIPNLSNAIVENASKISFLGQNLDAGTVKEYMNGAFSWITPSAGAEGVKSALGTVFNIAGGVISVVTAILMSLYIVADHDNFVDLLLLRIIDERKRRRVKQLVFDVEEKLGSWLLGQAILGFIIGFMVWVVLTVLNVPFALPLAVIAGLLEAIPNLGPIIAAVPALIMSLIAGGPVTTLMVAIAYFIIQQLENTIIVPKVMANAVGLKPIAVIIAVASGFTLAGPIGALLSVPVAVLLQIAYEFYVDLQKLKAKGIV